MRLMAVAGLSLLLSARVWAQAPAAAPNAHPDQSELFMVLDGTGSSVWGGKLVGETRNGANLTWKSIEGGPTQKLAKGDFFVVPPGLPHMFANIAPGGLQLMQLYLPRTR